VNNIDKNKMLEHIDEARLAVKWVVDHEHRAHSFDKPYAKLALEHLIEALRIARKLVDEVADCAPSRGITDSAKRLDRARTSDPCEPIIQNRARAQSSEGGELSVLTVAIVTKLRK
jgi:hypothetical protein